MAVLSNAERVDVRAKWMRENTDTCTLIKTDLLDAIAATDDWADLNASAFNLALPLIARTNLTAKQKARLLAFIIQRRFELS